MATIVAERDPRVDERRPVPRSTRTAPPSISRWRAHWPLTLLFLGFPLWWVLGLRTVLPIALGFVMADQLLRRRRVTLPRGFALWTLFLVWMLLGVFVLFADAPGAVPGGHGSRLVVFGYRVLWYFACTMVLLWVATLRESELPSRWLFQLLGYMFVVTTAGGLLGVLAPHLDFPSVLELALPHGLRSNGFVQQNVHPGVADYQRVLGTSLPRPKAPFPFANTWGSSLALFLPFFVISWWRDGRRWQRVATPFILLGALVPTVYSLNRGLWICLAVGVVAYLGLQLTRRRFGPLLIAVALLVAVAVAFLVSPLGTLFQERLAHGHSNERRGNLLVQTLTSTLQGSPVVGFGSTRDVAGNFTSIAGGSTPSCSACGVPPLGTQGTLWFVVFAEGFVGTALFLAFFLVAFQRSWRCRTSTETACAFVLVFFGIQLFVYDLIGTSLFVVMIAIGALWREQAGRREQRRYDAGRALRRLRARLPFLLALVVVGAALGAAVTTLRPATYRTDVSIALNPTPTSLGPTPATALAAASTAYAPGSTPFSKRETTTVDTEATVVTSDEVLSRVLPAAGEQRLARLRDRISVSAAANTRVMILQVSDTDAARSHDTAVRVADAYLTVRDAALHDRRDALLREQLITPETPGTRAGTTGNVATLALTPTTIGRVIRTTGARLERKQVEVPITSGAALGLAVGSLLLAGRPGWTPPGPRLRRRRRS